VPPSLLASSLKRDAPQITLRRDDPPAQDFLGARPPGFPSGRLFSFFLPGFFPFVGPVPQESNARQDRQDQAGPVKESKEIRNRLIPKGHLDVDRPEQNRRGGGGIMAFHARGRWPFLLRVADILRVAVYASLRVVPVLQKGLRMAHDPIGGQGHKEPFRRFGRFVTLGAGLWEAGSFHRGLRVGDFSDGMGRMAILAPGSAFHPAFQHHPVGALLVGFSGILMASGASDFRESFSGVDVRLGFLMAVGTSHSRRPVDRRLEGFLVHVKGKEGSVFLSLAEPGVLMALQTLRVIGGQGSSRPEKRPSQNREKSSTPPPKAPFFPSDHFLVLSSKTVKGEL